MKALLTWLTLLTAGVTVALLAVFLTRTLLSLRRTNRNLAQVVGQLEAVRDNTRPLEQMLPAINGVAATAEERLRAVDEHLQGILQAAQR